MKFYEAISKIFWFFSALFYNLAAYANRTAPPAKQVVARRLLIPSTETTTTSSFSGMTSNIFDFGTGLVQLLKTIAIFGGAVLIVFSIHQYIKHRSNPVETPLSTVIMLFFIGSILVAISFTSVVSF